MVRGGRRSCVKEHRLWQSGAAQSRKFASLRLYPEQRAVSARRPSDQVLLLPHQSFVILRRMRRFLPLLVFLASWSAPGVAAQKPGAFDGIDDALAQLAKITGLDPLKKVQHDTITRAGVKQ